jgi:hypothetical protein
MGAPFNAGTAHLPEMQIPLLESGSGGKEMTLPRDPIKAEEVRNKYRLCALKRANAWSKDEILQLESLILQYKTHLEIATLMNRTPGSVKSKSFELGLKSKVNDPGINNIHFKDTLVGYTGLHEWVRKYKPVPQSCEKCGKSGTLLEARNISGNYTRDLEDWEYLCVTCHRRIDGTRGGLKPKLSYGPNKKLLFHHQRKSP